MYGALHTEMEVHDPPAYTVCMRQKVYSIWSTGITNHPELIDTRHSFLKKNHKSPFTFISQNNIQLPTVVSIYALAPK